MRQYHRHVKLPLRLPTSLLSLPLALALSACASAPSDVVGRSSAAVVSATTTYLLPVEDDVREACRATWTQQFCEASAAQAAGDACVSALLSSGAQPACATSPAGCFELYTASTPCAAGGPIYPTPASCLAPVPRTCAFYSACLEADMPCGESGYAVGYGEKYCSRFDVDPGLSPAGLAWRDAVLHCLQEALVPELAQVSTMTCDAITTFAFDSHPVCYTEGPSICFLPPSDVASVLGTIDGKDLLSLRSAKQMAAVAATCVEQLAGAIFHFDAPGVRDGLPEELRDRAALNDRVLFWRDVQAHGMDGASRR
jgi:hypothetical protein